MISIDFGPLNFACVCHSDCGKREIHRFKSVAEQMRWRNSMREDSRSCVFWSFEADKRMVMKNAKEWTEENRDVLFTCHCGDGDPVTKREHFDQWDVKPEAIDPFKVFMDKALGKPTDEIADASFRHFQMVMAHPKFSKEYGFLPEDSGQL